MLVAIGVVGMPIVMWFVLFSLLGMNVDIRIGG